MSLEVNPLVYSHTTPKTLNLGSWYLDVSMPTETSCLTRQPPEEQNSLFTVGSDRAMTMATNLRVDEHGGGQGCQMQQKEKAADEIRVDRSQEYYAKQKSQT